MSRLVRRRGWAAVSTSSQDSRSLLHLRQACQIRATTERHSLARSGTVWPQKARWAGLYAADKGSRAAFGTLKASWRSSTDCLSCTDSCLTES